MRSLFRNLMPLSLAVVLAFPLLVTGCQSQENNYYTQWEHETHRQHVDLEKRNAAEQQEYRDWRQNHR